MINSNMKYFSQITLDLNGIFQIDENTKLLKNTFWVDFQNCFTFVVRITVQFIKFFRLKFVNDMNLYNETYILCSMYSMAILKCQCFLHDNKESF